MQISINYTAYIWTYSTCICVKHKKLLFAIIFTATFYTPAMHYLEGVQEIVVQIEYFTSERWRSLGSDSWSNLYTCNLQTFHSILYVWKSLFNFVPVRDLH